MVKHCMWLQVVAVDIRLGLVSIYSQGRLAGKKSGQIKLRLIEIVGMDPQIILYCKVAILSLVIMKLHLISVETWA